MGFRYLFFIACFLILRPPLSAFSDEPSHVVVGRIALSGNEKTKDFIVFRELDFLVGDSLELASLEDRLQKNRNRIFNTRLFNHVDIKTMLTGQQVEIEIRLVEKWYIWPYPVLQFADRNFNIWWESRDPERLNYGLNIYHFNFRGRGEVLKLRTLWGYTRSAGLDYEIPYLDHKKKKGLHVAASYQDNREVWFRTENNRLQFFFDPLKRAVRTFNADVSYIYRPGLYIRHIFSAGAENIHVSDTVLSEVVNPGFLAGGKKEQTSLKLWYTFKWDRRDIAYYPLKGSFLEINVEPRYLVQDKSVYFLLRWNVEKFWQLDRNVFSGASFKGKFSEPQAQPYRLMQALGYKDFVRGFEPYVIDGQSYILFQSNIKYRFLHGNFELPPVSMAQFRKVPYAVFATFYADAGYAAARHLELRGNTYRNSWLSGYGAGLDFITYYDRVMRIEYSINNFGHKGVYLHFSAPI
jgi:outer membrane protein assembly factor BamA